LVASNETEEYGRESSGRFEGVSRGPGANLNAAIQHAAKAAADAGFAGREFDLTIRIEPQDHNQWVKAFRAIITD
jgi:hypothetical protein